MISNECKMNFDKVKRLVVFGDSNTYGHNMYDADNIYFKVPSNKTWANQVASSLGIPLVNKAIPGSGNDSIQRLFLEYICQEIPIYDDIERFSTFYEPGDGIIICFSFLERMEIYDKENNKYHRMIANSKLPDQKLKDSLHYIWAMEPKFILQRKLLHMIYQIVEICKNKNIPLLITHVLNTFDGGYIENENLNSSLKSKINVSWIKEGIINFLREYNRKTGATVQLPCHHPNELGHKLWGERVIKYINYNT